MDIFLAKMVFRGNSLQRFRSVGLSAVRSLMCGESAAKVGVFFCTNQWIHLIDEQRPVTSSPRKVVCSAIFFLGGMRVPQLPTLPETNIAPKNDGFQ